MPVPPPTTSTRPLEPLCASRARRGSAAAISALVDAAHERREFALRGRHHAEIVEQHHAGVFRARAQEQPGLEADEAQREFGAHRLLAAPRRCRHRLPRECPAPAPDAAPR